MPNREKNGPTLSRRALMIGAGGLILLPALGAARRALAQSVADIKKAGILKVGSQEANPPWGFVNNQGRLAGLDIDLSRKLAAYLGVEARFTPVTPANRTVALLTGKVDVLAAAVSIFPDRQKVVLFSRPYCNSDTIFIGKAGRPIKGWADMNGMRVGVPRGTPQDLAITKAAPPGVTIRRYDDDATTVQAMLSGQVDMIGGQSTQVANIAKVVGPGKYVEKFVLARAYDAFAVRPGSRDLVNSINDFIAAELKSGDLNAMFKKWVGEDLAKLPTTGEGPAALPIIITPP